MMLVHDTLQRFLFTSAPVRGEIVHLHASYQAILSRHPYPPAIATLLGEGLAASALLSATIKFSGSLILQIQSDGPVSLLVIQSSEQYHLRGLAKWHGDISSAAFKDLIGDGHLAITVIPNDSERYQGIVELNSDNLAATLEKYFEQSEQLPTCIFLAASQEVAAGFFLQMMPEDHLEVDRRNFWEHVVHLARTITAQELLQLSNEQLLGRLYPEEDIQLFELEPVSFRCNCTPERMENALRMMEYAEVMDIFKTHKMVTVTCEFCHHQYHFDVVDIDRIFADNAVSPSSGAQH